MRSRAVLAAFCAAFCFSCASAPVIPSAEHPRVACYVTCSDGRPLRSRWQRECVGGANLAIRGKNVSIVGEVIDEQNPHASFWLTKELDGERGKYPKDDVVDGTCTMFFIGRGAVDEHQIGVLRSAEHQ
jgi:hypothetical protein